MNKIVKLVLFLGIVSAVSGLLLGFVNDLTAPIIEKNANAAEYATLEVMYPGAEYEKLDITNDVIAGAYEAKGQGYAFKCTGKGYHEMTILIGLDYDGTIISVIPLEHQETSGFGAELFNPDNSTEGELFKDDAIASLYVGKTLDQEVDSRAGATLTSKAMVTMTNACKEAYKSIK